jgi:tetratricopeptide (TPR) repeat protein
MPIHAAIAVIRAKQTALPENDLERATLQAEIASEYARAGMPREGLEAVRSGISMIDAHDANQALTARGDLYNAAAMCHYARNDFLMSIASGVDAYQIFHRQGDDARMGHALTTLASACMEVQAPDLAEQALNGCLSIALKTGDQFLEARARNTLGMLLGDAGRFDEAETHLLASKEILVMLGRRAQTPKVIGNIGNLYKKRALEDRRLGQHDQARYWFDRAVAMVQDGFDAAEANDNKFDAADKMGSLGEYYFLMENFDLAKDAFVRALVYANEIQHLHTIAESHLFLGRVSQREGNHVEAEKQLRIALDRAKQAELRKLIREAHRELADCLSAQGRESDAATHAAAADEANAVSDSNNFEAQREIRAMWSHVFSQHPLLKTLETTRG